MTPSAPEWGDDLGTLCAERGNRKALTSSVGRLAPGCYERPPSKFALLPRLIEPDDGMPEGVSTAIYTVLLAGSLPRSGIEAATKHPEVSSIAGRNRVEQGSGTLPDRSAK